MLAISLRHHPLRRTSPPWLPLITSDDPKVNHYPGAGWSDDASLIETLDSPPQAGESEGPSIRSSNCRETARSTATWGVAPRIRLIAANAESEQDPLHRCIRTYGVACTPRPNISRRVHAVLDRG